MDQDSSPLLAWTDLSGWSLSETIFMLHTGQGAAVLDLVLGLMALGVPVMARTGVVLWLAARRGRPRIRGKAPAGRPRRSCWSAARAAAPRALPRRFLRH